MIKTLLLLGVFITSVTLLHGQPSPGGISGNLRWWVKADAGVFEGNGTNSAESGDGVWVWDDNSPGDIDAINSVSGTRPIYRTAVINGNPALEFDGTKFLDGEALSGIGATESFNIFLVFKQNSYQTNGGINDGEGTFIIDRPSATLGLTSFKVANTDKYFYQRRQDDNNNLGGAVSVTPVDTSSFIIAEYYRNTSTTREGIYLDGRQDIDQAGINGDITGPAIRIGRHATNGTGGLNGYFSEMIIYDANLSIGNRRRIESYLAIKYGITLNQTTLTDYLRSDGSVIYPAASTASYGTYVFDIAGIGQDDDSGLDQDDSRSQNTNAMLRVYNPSSLGNGDFLVWGNNKGSLTTPNTADVDGSIIERRLSRVWRVAETGNVGTVTMEFDLSSVPGAKTQADLRLLVDRDGDGFSDNDRTPRSGTLVGNMFTVTAVNIGSGDYFTIGTANASSTPLPIDLLEFNIIYEDPVVVAYWRTASELNNDYFTLERAGPDLAFEEIAKIPGAGTSKITASYSEIDTYPYPGKSYYRLKQTDFDGTVTYFGIKFMSIKETQKSISVFPNPSKGSAINFSWGNSEFNLNHVEILNQQGQTIEISFVDERNLRSYSVQLNRRLAPGLYILRANYNGKDEFVKFLVQK